MFMIYILSLKFCWFESNSYYPLFENFYAETKTLIKFFPLAKFPVVLTSIFIAYVYILFAYFVLYNSLRGKILRVLTEHTQNPLFL